MAKIDLHIHSNYSDGSDTIQELAENIKMSGLGVFALTDHDTIDGCKALAPLIPDDIKFIHGVELTCKARECKCHILGYNYNENLSELKELLEKGKQLRLHRLETRINYLKDKFGIILSKKELDWLYSRRSVVKMHIANVLVERGLAGNNIEAMRKYLNGCSTGNSRFDGEEAINAILKSGGIPIWAHPLGGECEKHLKEDEFIPKLKTLIDCGIQGLECYYSRYSEDEINFLVNCANKYKLFITGGSDYHGTNKNIPLGTLNCQNLYIDSSKLNLGNLLN